MRWPRAAAEAKQRFPTEPKPYVAMHWDQVHCKADTSRDTHSGPQLRHGRYEGYSNAYQRDGRELSGHTEPAPPRMQHHQDDQAMGCRQVDLPIAADRAPR